MVKKITPLMLQYNEQKKLHPDKLILFRMGDFYELFGEDAIVAAPILGIALTVRNRKQEDSTKMCGVPHHSIAGPINKLLQAGYKVAICDQLEDPKNAKGLVKRGVTRVLSPGMVYDPDDLEAMKANYLCSYDDKTISFLESTTGESFYFERSEGMKIQEIIHLLSPSELVLSPKEKQDYLSEKKEVGGPFVSEYSLEKVNDKENLPLSYQRLFAYAKSMQGDEIESILQKLEKRLWQESLTLDKNAIQNLELLQSYQGEKRGSFYQTLQKCRSSAGARLWKKWMLFPLRNKKEVSSRQDKVAFWMDNFHPSEKYPGMNKVRDQISNMGDLERRLGKVSHPNSSPRDLELLSKSMIAGLELSSLTSFFSYDKKAIQICDQLASEINQAIKEDAPAQFNKNYFIKKGYESELDEWIDLSENVERKVKEMEEKEREKLGISTLKIRHNQVFGYYIEVTNTHKDKIPKEYLRKQTLTNAERYTTEDLQELEKKVLSAKTKRFELEAAAFFKIRKQVLENASYLLRLAKAWAELDVITSLAFLAKEKKWVRPEFDEEGFSFQKLRHPVVEEMQKAPFIANDIDLKKGHSLLITGPNMAGKSTLMRQMALASILAQMGSFVPAKSAKLPIVDRIFTRIGASDSLSEGLSTFMVEMKECSEIFHYKTKNSLIILDEIGRGTSTYDGMSLAQAILESLLEDKNSYTLFSTHYHELTKMEARFDNIHNFHMSIQEEKGSLRFLYRLKKGPANRSYGIHVAELAGLPKEVVKRAKQVLESLEKSAKKTNLSQMDLFELALEDTSTEESPVLENISSTANQEKTSHPLIEDFRNIQIEQMSPMDALNWLYEKKQDLQ